MRTTRHTPPHPSSPLDELLARLLHVQPADVLARVQHQSTVSLAGGQVLELHVCLGKRVGGGWDDNEMTSTVWDENPLWGEEMGALPSARGHLDRE